MIDKFFVDQPPCFHLAPKDLFVGGCFSPTTTTARQKSTALEKSGKGIAVGLAALRAVLQTMSDVELMSS